MIAQLSRYAKSSTFVNAGVGIVGVLLLFIFFAVGEPFGTLNDIAIVLWAAFLIPIMLGLYQSSQNRTATLGLAGLVVGLLGVLGVISVQILLIMHIMDFWQQQPYLYASYCLLGLWLLIVSRLAHPAPLASSGLMWFGTVLGVMWFATPVFIWVGGLPPSGSDAASVFSTISSITYVGFSMFFVTYLLQPVWALWLARTLR